MPVPDFSPGEVLTASAMDSIGLWLVKSQTIGTGVSVVNITNVFSTDYDVYKVTISGGVASGDVAISLRLGASTTGYYGMLSYALYSATSISAAGDNNGSRWVYAGVGTAQTLHMNLDLNGPFLAKPTTITATYAQSSAGGSGGTYMGFHNVATSYTDLSINMSAGTLTGGIIRVYGYRK